MGLTKHTTTALWGFCLVFFSQVHATSVQPVYYTGHGFTNNQCPSAQCSRCEMGKYRSQCQKTSEGSCVACTNTRPSNSYYNSDGGFDNTCSFACNQGLYLKDAVCEQAYTVKLAVAIPSSSPEQMGRDIPKIIGVFAGISNCGTCEGVPNGPVKTPVICTRCNISFTVGDETGPIQLPQPSTRRRLLESTTLYNVDMSIDTQNGKANADGLVFSLTQNGINNKLATQGLGTATVTTPAAVSASPVVLEPVVTTVENRPITTQPNNVPPPPTTQAVARVVTTSTPPPSSTPTPEETGLSPLVLVAAIAGGVVVLIGAITVGVVLGTKKPAATQPEPVPTPMPAPATLPATTPSTKQAKFQANASMVHLGAAPATSIQWPHIPVASIPPAPLVAGHKGKPPLTTPTTIHATDSRFYLTTMALPGSVTKRK